MYLKKQELKINPQNPFEQDKLHRLESAQVLTELFKSTEGPFVLSIDSSWGTGKTTFVKMWKEYLSSEENNFHCLYFNAWENDFADDPLISFIGEIQLGVIATLNIKDSKAKKYFAKAKKISGSLVKKGVPAVVKGLTYGLLDLEEINEQIIADLAYSIAQGEIENYEKNKNTLLEFKQNLEAFMAELSKSDGSSGKPLIFFVDELDRCRPIYAVELLERIKHLFNVPGVIFVLVLDKDQLAHSIKSLYGVGMNVDGYLRRFIDLDYQLPKASNSDFCNHLFQEFGFQEFFTKRKVRDTDEAEQFLNTFIKLAEIFNLSLRELEQCFTQVSIAFRTTPENKKIYPLLLAFLIILKNVNHSLYNQYITGTIAARRVIEFIKEQPKGADFLDDNYGQAVEAYILGAFCGGYDGLRKLISEYEKELEKENTSEKEKQKLSHLLEFFQFFARQNNYSMGIYLVKKIQILDRFVA
ncbi:MAG: hypothetical protein HS126_35320 [Anaerolineales bacterium]|nr:hypothetical protein [Anaerolineales bacterium]